MAISRIGSATANDTTVTIPSHQKGDTIMMVAYRNSSNTYPTVPSGWTVHRTINGGTNCIVIASRIANGASETSGTWTNATQLATAVYRSSTGLVVCGNTIATQSSAGSGGNIVYTALAVASNVTNHWIFGGVGHRSIDTDCEVAPTGLTNITSVVGGAAGELAIHDSNGNLNTWGTTNYTLTAGTSSGYCSFCIGLAETDYTPPSGSTQAYVIGG